MRIKSYIKEYQDVKSQVKSRVRPLDEDKAIDLLRANCQDAMKKWVNGNTVIQRYATTYKDLKFGYVDSSNLPDRLSRNTSNYYTHIINNDSKWKRFPRRQMIGMVKVHMDIPRSYDHVFVFPYNGVKVGVCPSSDIWPSFKYLYNNHNMLAQDFNAVISMLLSLVDIKNADSSYDAFGYACTQFDNWYESNPDIAKSII